MPSPIRMLFPKWKFFASADQKLILYYRLNCHANDNLKNDNNQASQNFWQPLLPEIEFSFWHLILNPNGNLLHKANSLLQDFVSDLQSINEIKNINNSELSELNSDAVLHLTSYRLVVNLVRFYLNSKGLNTHAKLQFCIGLHDNSKPENFHPIFISSILDGSSQ